MHEMGFSSECSFPAWEIRTGLNEQSEKGPQVEGVRGSPSGESVCRHLEAQVSITDQAVGLLGNGHPALPLHLPLPQSRDRATSPRETSDGAEHGAVVALIREGDPEPLCLELRAQ